MTGAMQSIRTQPEESPAAADRDAVLSARHLKKIYGGGEPVEAIRDATLFLRRGELVAVMGASGSGKSTLLHLLGGLDTPTSGAVIVDGVDLASLSDTQRTLFRRRRMGIVFQAYNLIPTLTAVQNVALPALLDGKVGAAVEAKARALLARVDMLHRAAHRPQALSGGEQQRVAIARALMNDPAVLLADEPTGNLDSAHGEAVWKLLSALTRENGRTIVAVTHECDGAAYADRIIVLKDGVVVGEIPTGGEMDASTLAARYRRLVG